MGARPVAELGGGAAAARAGRRRLDNFGSVLGPELRDHRLIKRVGVVLDGREDAPLLVVAEHLAKGLVGVEAGELPGGCRRRGLSGRRRKLFGCRLQPPHFR